MEFSIWDIFKTQPMHGGTINGWIMIPGSFVILIYAAAAIAIGLTAGYLVFKKKSRLMPALGKASVVAFFCTGFLYLVYSERTWYGWFIEDSGIYSGHTTEEKTRMFLGPLFDFIASAKKAIHGEDYTLYCSDTATYLMTQYYLLPERNRGEADYIIVLYDGNSYYDAGTKTFMRGDRRMNNVDLLYRYDFGAYILKKG
ncbi:MAG TPA: hypothetical protein VFG09_09690 [Thermodesulfovibrionales bacterium]|jgi:hypothetical protein|nr:hypothetical protein [Thermodesulfovibrionales bacterium]